MAVWSEAFSQAILQQNFYGNVTDSHTKTPLSAVSVLIQNSEFEKGATTDTLGNFQFKGIPVGRYRVTLSHLGYGRVQLNDVLIESAKEKYLEVELTAMARQLDEVSISAASSAHEIENIGSVRFSQEQSQRFAATFYDPGRMGLSFAGVTSTSDQGNSLSIRGNAPHTNRWRLEGADIVNPNHLTNAGTFTDRISVSGGGVTLISAQLMSDTKLQTGALPAAYSDALGGIMDVNLRAGNRYKREHTLQAGLLGIDLATEGPFSKGSSASYLVNYRYSTIGMLQSLGVEVSDETINFQDFSFVVSAPGTRTGDWTAFGVVGLSSEKFKAERDSAAWEYDESRINTDFYSNMGALGISNKKQIGKSTSLKTVAAISEIRTRRAADIMDESYEITPYQRDRYHHGMISVNSTVNHRTAGNHTLTGGIIYNRVFFDLLSQERWPEPTITFAESQGGFDIIRAFGEWAFFLAPRLKAKTGLHLSYFGLNREFSPEPRVQLEYLAGDRSTLALYYGLVSQSQFPQVYFVRDAAGNLPNSHLALSKSHQFSAAYSRRFSAYTTAKIEAYFQQHVNVPVSADPSSTFSLLNAVDVLIDMPLINEGKGYNQGIEFTLSRDFKAGYYMLGSASLYDSKYTALDGIKRNTRYNGRYAFSVTAGKEYHRLTKGKNRIFGFNARGFWQGGYRHSPIDLEASTAAGKTVFAENEAFSLKFKDYFRVDFRVYFKRNKEKYTRTLSLDIQNMTARQNIAYEYFDPYLNKVVTKKQLGILPFLSYRVEF